VSTVVVIEAWPSSSFTFPSRRLDANQPGGVRVPEQVRSERDPGAAAQPADEVVDGRIGQRVTLRLAPQVDEHVVGVQRAVLAVEIVGTCLPDSLRCAPGGTWTGGDDLSVGGRGLIAG